GAAWQQMSRTIKDQIEIDRQLHLLGTTIGAFQLENGRRGRGQREALWSDRRRRGHSEILRASRDIGGVAERACPQYPRHVEMHLDRRRLRVLRDRWRGGHDDADDVRHTAKILNLVA